MIKALKSIGHHPRTASGSLFPIEIATYESIPFRYIAGGLHPDHDTIAHFRKTFLSEIVTLFAQVLLVAREAGVLELGNISLDGSKVHADLPVRRTQTGLPGFQLEAAASADEQLMPAG
ncbi:MAG: hypothetical protein MAG451_01731 [Anaerolineales bacterium]|nr:hypothetical protein [Anaerolineales bacterium]